MTNSQASALTLHWVPVVDADGRTHLEAVWSAAGHSAHTTHAA